MSDRHELPGKTAAIERARTLLAERFGYPAFRPGQEAALESIFAGRNLLAVMPTGSGKSLLYQLPAIMGDSLTLVVSPLISLMKDQVDDLARRGVPAAFVNSSLDPARQREEIRAAVEGRTRLLYVAPERFRSQAFLDMLQRVKVSRLAIDEAHCISEWGHDFRPDYLQLKRFRQLMENPPVTALTATATVRVQRDIITSLGLDGEVDVHVHGFDRPNLELDVVKAASEADKDAFLSRLVRREKGCGIIYAGTRRATEELAAMLSDVETGTRAYNAGMEADDRTEVQEAFLSGRARVIVATSAFGMGIDKSDVRFVAHYNYPGSIEQYYQEIGRAGRDGLPSRCILLYMPSDRYLREFFVDLAYPARPQVKSVYKALWRLDENPVMRTYEQVASICDEEIKEGQVAAAVKLLDGAGVTRALAGDARIAFTLSEPAAGILPRVRGPMQQRVLEALSSVADIEVPGRYEAHLAQICSASGLSDDQVRRALGTLAASGLIEYEPPFRGRGIEKLAKAPPPFERLAIDWKRHDALRAAEMEKLSAMEGYMGSGGCRRGYILKYFGQTDPFQCGSCDNCLSRAKNDARAQSGQPAAGEPGPGADAVLANPEIALPVLVCMANLRFPLGRDKVCLILAGSRDKQLLEWGAPDNPAYGRVGAGREAVRATIEQLAAAGFIEQAGNALRPTLTLTAKGKAAAQAADLDSLPRSRRSAGVPPRGANAPASRGASGAPGGGVRLAALKCAASMKLPIGISRMAAILTGSQAEWITPWGAAKLDVYNSIDLGQSTVRAFIMDMLAEGIFSRDASAAYPVLNLTAAGRAELSRLAPGWSPTVMAGIAPEPAPAEESASQGRPSGGAPSIAPPEAAATSDATSDGTTATPLSDAIDVMIRRLLADEPEAAKAMVGALRLANPMDLARRLERHFAAAAEVRARSRVVWAVGELCGVHGIAFLIERASSGEPNIRRLAAGALGKVAPLLKADLSAAGPCLDGVKRALDALSRDDAPQVRQYAAKALDQSGLA